MNTLYVKASYRVNKLYAKNLSIIGDEANQVLNILKGSILWNVFDTLFPKTKIYSKKGTDLSRSVTWLCLLSKLFVAGHDIGVRISSVNISLHQ